MTQIATLSMYDVPSVRSETDALWVAIASELRKAGVAPPDQLTRGARDWDVWYDPHLLFSQTCGFPYVSKLQNRVTLIGTSDFGMIEGKPGWYNSVVIVRADDPRAGLADFAGATFAYNDLASQSGLMSIMYLLHKTLGDARHFGVCVASEGHALSAQMVARGDADIAAVDCVTWLHICRDFPDMKLRVLCETEPTPALPYITHFDQPAEVFADAVEAAIETLPSAHKDALFLRGFWRSTPADYALIHARAKAATPVIQAHFDGHDPLT